MTLSGQSSDTSLTPRAAIVAACLVLLWTGGGLMAAAHWSIYTQHLLMLIGFGAILTIFLVRFPGVFLVSTLAVWIGSFAWALALASPDDRLRLWHGWAASAALVLPTAALAAWMSLRPLKRGELVIVYAAVAVAIPWTVCLKAVIESSAGNLIEVQRQGEQQAYAWAKEMPWWGPTVATGRDAPPSPEALAAAQGFAEGNGGHVPWALWWRPMLYWSALCGCWAAMIMGILLLFRKRWIEHERLPFVWALPALEFIRGTGAGAGALDLDAPPAGRLGRRGWTMFLIGLAMCAPGILFMSPTGTAMTTWICPPWEGQPGILGGVDLTDLNLIPGVNLRLTWGPIVLLAMLLFPVDVLLTTALTYILLSILLPGALESLGLAAAKAHVGGFVRAGLQLGGAAGLVLWSFWFNRRTVWGYLRSLWNRPPANPESDDELGRRKIVLMALVGLAGFIALGAYAAQPYWHVTVFGFAIPIPSQMLVLTALILIYTISQVRMRAEGQPTTYDNNAVSHQLVSLQRDFWYDHYSLAYRGAPVTRTSWASQWLQWGFCGQLKSFGPHNALLEAFKIGHETGVNARVIGKTILVTLVGVGLLAPLLYLQLIYAYGYENSCQGMLSYTIDYAQWAERAARYGLDSTSHVFWTPADHFYDRYSTFFNMGYGMAVVGLLFYLRREFPRFPISPVGVVMASQFHSAQTVFSTDSVWFSFLLAGIAKTLIFRWMGVRSFRERVQPAVILMLCGVIFGMMLYLFRHVILGQGCLN